MKKTVLAAALLASVNVSALQLDLDNKYVGASMHIVDYDIGIWDLDNSIGFGGVVGVPFKGLTNAGLPEQINLSAEAGFIYLGSSEFDGTSNELTGYSMLGAGKLGFSFNEQASIHAKLGLNYLTLDSDYYDDSEMNILYGIGGEFKLNQQLSVEANYTVFGEVDVIDVSSMNAGVNYKF